MRQLRFLTIPAALVVASIASAHHSALIFNRDVVVAFEGTVTNFGWANPHVYIHVETTDDAGEVVEWEFETDATPILSRSGWSRDSLAPGDTVLVRGNPDKSGRAHALLVSLTKEDGEVLAARSYFLRKSDDPANVPRTGSLEGIWELDFADYTAFYRAWDQIELTAAGIASRDSYD
ncbi:MAG: hypothetical protein HKN84_06420, partial [Gammaproteobacteria bacterium]|nr:hypothetical protein [Gammaproteobacteria bacterium]